jgi:hypothetical protein
MYFPFLINQPSLYSKENIFSLKAVPPTRSATHAPFFQQVGLPFARPFNIDAHPPTGKKSPSPARFSTDAPFFSAGRASIIMPRRGTPDRSSWMMTPWPAGNCHGPFRRLDDERPYFQQVGLPCPTVHRG